MTNDHAWTPGTELAVPPGPTDPAGTPLTQVPTPALTLALGYTMSQPVRADKWGGVCALVEELEARMVRRPGSSIPTTAYAALLASLPPEVATALRTLYTMQRGQRWAQTGRRPR